jgi:hypothetical protein
MYGLFALIASGAHTESLLFPQVWFRVRRIYQANATPLAHEKNLHGEQEG